MSQTLIIAGTILFLTSVFYLVLSQLLRKIKFKKRLNAFEHIPKSSKGPVEIIEKKQEEKFGVSIIKKVGKLLEQTGKDNKWAKLLVQANSKLSPGEFLLFRLVSLVTLVVVGYVLNIYPILLIPIGMVGFWLPVFNLRKKLEKRLNLSSHQLAEALGTMANSMRAGFSFMQAMKLTAEEFEDPIGPEFEITMQEINYGVPVEEAFLRLLERLPDRELEMAVKAMLIQRTSGGNLAVLLETIQETIIGRLQIKDEIKTLTAQGKLSSYIITGLPFGLAIYLRVMNPDFTKLMWEHPLGIFMLSVGAIGILMGWIFIRKIIRIEV